MTRYSESGQALVSGLIFLFLSFLCCAYFLYIAESFFRGYSNTEKAREETLKKATFVANTINQISLNNQSILAALSVTENAFAKAAELGLYIGFTQPYWETYKNIKNNKDEFLSNKSKIATYTLYKNFSLTSARGFVIAKSLSEKNRTLIQSLPANINKYFSQSNNAETFCLALETQNDHYKIPGFYNIAGLEHLYRFYLEKDNCTIKHTQGIIGFIDQTLPLLFFNEKDEILSYEEFDKINPNEHYGIWYVHFSQAQNFLESISFSAENLVNSPNPRFTIISRYLNKIPFFNDLSLTKKEILSGYAKKIKTRITHPNFVCSFKRQWFSDFLKEEDWQKISQCNLSNDHFLQSFFISKWAAIITEEKDTRDK